MIPVGDRFDTSDVDAERARADHAERVCRTLITQRNRAYQRGRTEALEELEIECCPLSDS